MKGDFSRDTFDARKHFSRVLMQQGRVQLDADWNEQAAILLHYLQTLAADLIGPHGGPEDGFMIVACKDSDGNPIVCPENDSNNTEVTHLQKDFFIMPGHYYVQGVLCELEELEEPVSYLHQPNYPEPPILTGAVDGENYLVYLDVWERHLTYVEVEDEVGSVISIREVALGGPDTATRAEVVWQVKVKASEIDVADAQDYDVFLTKLGDEIRPGTGRLKARATGSQSSAPDNPCITPPESRYRGAENQLYRVEIHNGGTAGNGATFKWSRENGSVILAIEAIDGDRVTLKDLGRDARLGLQPDDWVEIVDDNYTLQNRAEPLLQVDTIDPDRNIVTLKSVPTIGQDSSKYPFLRRWDQREAKDVQLTGNGVPVVEGKNNGNWIELENGVEIQFQQEQGATYRTGDYWLIPARTATGDVEWPGPKNAPEAQKPHGVTHHYAPLWIISVGADGIVEAKSDNDCRRSFERLAKGHREQPFNRHSVRSA